MAQVSFWNNATTPSVPYVASDTAGLTLGLQFFSDTPGLVTGVRFYKGSRNTGQHIGILWSSAGLKLAQVTFSAETTSGWQQANFAVPVSISANTPYVISYFAPQGNYAVDVNYAWSKLTAPPIHPTNSSAGVYAYSGTPTFPAAVHNACNYWVDPVFVAGVAQPPAAQSESLSFWSGGTTPRTASFTGDTSALTLGLQFTSDVAGSITGVRFYKGATNTGPHVAALWTGTGVKLAEVTVSGETASGWQSATFPSSVTILPKTTYVVSYFAPHGNYAFDGSYAWSGLNSLPLRAAGSSPGVYAYGASNTFPQATNSGGNYWIDPIFTTAGSTVALPATYSISGTVTGTSATVTLSGVISQSATTDAAGRFTFTGLPNGLYVVSVSRSGFIFSPPTLTVVINGAAVTSINFVGTVAPHSTTITWAPSTSANLKGYNLYRSTVSGGPYSKLTASPISTTGFNDSGVVAGKTYFYVATSVDTSNRESTYSNVGIAVIPAP